MPLHVHRAERADRLAAALAEVLADPPADPFVDEVVAVPARGVERWLTQQLAHRLGRRDGRADGVCAGVRFPSPRRLVAEVVHVDGRDPWAPDDLAWALLAVLDECAGEAWCSAVGQHLGAGTQDTAEREQRRGRRYAVARRLAGLFDTYASARPDMLGAWARGDDCDGLGSRLPPDLAWQPPLWRRLRERVGGPDPLQRVAEAARLLRADPSSVELPPRLSLFGPTRLARLDLQVLSALAEAREVHLWLPHPSPELWDRVVRLAPERAVPRRVDPSRAAAVHPLLSSLGRDARELALTLAPVARVDHRHRGAQGTAAPPTLLALLQRDLCDDRRPLDDDRRPTVDPGDRTVAVHACHGPARQVEVLREVLVGLLADDPTLEPRDVLVMCPDIEAYAPLVAAAFGLADVTPDGHPGHGLRVRLADRSLRQTNPLLATVSRLLDLATARVTASEVLDLAAWGPVRRRFGFGDDDLERLAEWVSASGVRWGLDAAHRAPWSLSTVPQNTWRTGLDRVLLGAAMADEDANRLGLALPLDDVGSGDVDLAGRLAELLARLAATLDELGGLGDRPLAAWLAAVLEGVERLTAVASADLWQAGELRRVLADAEESAGERARTLPLSLPDVRALLAHQLRGRPTRANFRTGTLTVCTMVPMRSVPHRVVCLLGLDDGAFPRGARRDGDDVLARDPATGEPDARAEDRQLMLDALLAATERVVVTYSGADERTGAPRPPAVPLGELLDALDETARAAAGPLRDQVLVRHPLQPFDARGMRVGALGALGRPFSHDRSALAGAEAARRPRAEPPAFLPAPLAPPAAAYASVELASLTDLLVRPARAFLRQRLDVAVPFEEDEPSDRLTVELDGLTSWEVADRILRERLRGASAEDARQAEWRRGALPPGSLGARALDRVLSEVEPLVAGTAALRAPGRRTLDVSVPLDGGRVLRGTVTGLCGDVLLSISYSRLGPGQRLRAWVSLLALAAGAPGRPWTSVTVGRGSPQRPRQAVAGPVDALGARRELSRLVDLYERGLREPLPLPLRAACAYAETRHSGQDHETAAAKAAASWTVDRFPGEDQDPSHLRVWGGVVPFERLLAEPPPPDERWLGESSRFAELAQRLWLPLLEVEEVLPL